MLQKGKADDAVVEKTLRREDVERYLEQVLNKCKSRSLLLHSIEICSTETGMWAVRIAGQVREGDGQVCGLLY